jgi:predicted GNAT family N-acyltransferase
MSSDLEKKSVKSNSLRAITVATQQQLIDALVVRGICFVHEQSMKSSFIFDGNDAQATHLLLYDGDEPIGASRLRWFKDFAKVERTCIRPEWRNPRTLKSFCDYIFETAARKGYDKMITYANPKLATMWQRLFGFRPVEGRPPFLIAGHDEPYIELVRHLDVPDDAITPQSDANRMFRIEGRWDEPTPIEMLGVN